jgi:hypothetical protein
MDYTVIVIIFLVLAGLYYKRNDIQLAIRGERGKQGLQGLQGEAGTEGAQGPPGPIGAVGPAGPTGARGMPGIAGPQGIPGLRGEAGDIGPQGIPGPAGLKGEQGIAGPVGPAGPRGPIGETGPTGEAGPIGPMGKVGMTGPKGPPGPIGPIGPMGKIGPPGLPGKQGTVGPQGIPGRPGPGFSPSTMQMMNQQIKPYFAAQKCVKLQATGGNFNCPPNHFISGMGGLSKDGRVIPGTSYGKCCYGIGATQPIANQPAQPLKLTAAQPAQPLKVTAFCPPGGHWKPLGKVGSPTHCKHITGKIIPAKPTRETYTPLGQVATAPNIMNAQRVMVEQEARAIQLRNLLGTGRQLVSEGNRPIISGGGTVLRVASEASPATMDRIRIAEQGPVPDSFLGTAAR